MSSLVFTQEEKLEIDGAIQIGDAEDPTPDPGTIRWNGIDFEGYSGTAWISLTKGDTIPHLTNAERDAITIPQAGLQIFNTDSHCTEIYRGSGWYNLCNGGFFVSQPINKLIGGSGSDYAHSVTPTTDGGFVVAGYSSSSANGDVTGTNNGNTDYWIVKLDASGDILWNKLMGGSDYDYARSVTPTTDGGVIVAGNSTSSANGDVTGTSNGNRDYWVVKLDASGNILWNKLIGGSADDFAQSVTSTSDGGVVVAGHSISSVNGDVTGTSNGNRDYWIVKLDASGNILWNELIGGSLDDYGQSVTSTSDGGVVVAGHSISSANGDVTGTNNGSFDYWIIKLNANGNILWNKLIGGSADEIARSVTSTPDGGFVVVGSSSSSANGDVTGTINGNRDYWIVKLDANGDISWNKLIGGNLIDEAYSVTSTADGGVVVAGFSSSSANGDVTDTNNGNRDYWVVKLDASGNILWNKLIGGTSNDYGYSVTSTTDGGVVVAGYSISSANGDVTSTNNGNNDYWIVKLDASGNIQN